MTKSLLKTEKKSKNKPKVIAIVGATASGKTAYAIELAKKIDGEVISADSRLVYKGFNIVCAKPALEETCGIPHYMMDIVEPEFDFSAGLYAKEAKKIIYDIIKRNKTPIIAGGTGLYFRLLLENYVPPKIKPDYELRERLEKFESDKLFEIITDLDKDGAQTIDINDKKKLIRAIEIVKLSGKPLSEARGVKNDSEFDIEWIGRNYPRDELYERINKRVDVMYKNGMVEETKSLLKKHGRIPNITDTIGYKEIISYLDGECSVEEALDKLKQNTRRYAKRQLTWFRKNTKIKWNIYPDTKTK